MLEFYCLLLFDKQMAKSVEELICLSHIIGKIFMTRLLLLIANLLHQLLYFFMFLFDGLFFENLAENENQSLFILFINIGEGFLWICKILVFKKFIRFLNYFREPLRLSKLPLFDKTQFLQLECFIIEIFYLYEIYFRISLFQFKISCFGLFIWLKAFHHIVYHSIQIGLQSSDFYIYHLMIFLTLILQYIFLNLFGVIVNKVLQYVYSIDACNLVEKLLDTKLLIISQIL